MTNPKTSVSDQAKAAEQIANSGKTAQIPVGKRSPADERRFQDSLEDDEVRELLRAGHDRRP